MGNSWELSTGRGPRPVVEIEEAECMQDADKLAALAVEVYTILEGARAVAEGALDEIASSTAALDALFLELGVSPEDTQ